MIIKKWYNFNEIIKRKEKVLPVDIKKSIVKKTLNSVKINSRADVPISIALSGGLDSSLLMSICYNKNFLNKKPKCFSFQFEKDYSEKKFIDASTEFYGFKSNYVNFSKVDLLFNNAGVVAPSSFLNLSEKDWDWCNDINFNALVKLTRIFLPLLMKNEEAALINTSSIFVIITTPNNTVYQ